MRTLKNMLKRSRRVSVQSEPMEEIKEEAIISKVLKTLLPIYTIRVSTIQERRCEENHKINLDAIVGSVGTQNCIPILTAHS